MPDVILRAGGQSAEDTILRRGGDLVHNVAPATSWLLNQQQQHPVLSSLALATPIPGLLDLAHNVIGRPLAAVEGGLAETIAPAPQFTPQGQNIASRHPFQVAARGFLDPASAPLITERLPYTNFERTGSPARLIPRVLLEAGIQYGLTGGFNNVAGRAARMASESRPVRVAAEAIQKRLPITVEETEQIIRTGTRKPGFAKRVSQLSSEERQALMQRLSQPTPEARAIDARISQAPTVPKTSASPSIIDPAYVQKIRNSIAEGQMILRSGKDSSGHPMTREQLWAVRQSVQNAQAKIGEGVPLNKGYAIQDVTPAGYGPEPSTVAKPVQLAPPPGRISQPRCQGTPRAIGDSQPRTSDAP